MPIREFTDSTGARWLVWSTTPSLGGLPGEMRSGWLTFESEKARKRLIPIPANWEDASNERLELLCRSASEVRRTPANGLEAFDPPGR